MGERGSPGGLRTAAADIAAALARPWLWGALGWNDVRQRHAGSWLGSLWITLSLALVVGCLTLVFAGPLGGDLRTYPLYVAIGLVLWQLVQGTLAEAAGLFPASGETIRNATLPLSLHMLRLLWRNLLVLLHGLVLVPLLMLAARVAPSAAVWTVVPALALLVVFLFSAGLFLATLGARFRDVGPLVANATQLLFFVTPIFWLPAALGPGRAWLLAFNPFFAFIDIVRAPLLGDAPAAHSWPLAVASAAAAALVGVLALAAGRRRVAYWV